MAKALTEFREDLERSIYTYAEAYAASPTGKGKKLRLAHYNMLNHLAILDNIVDALGPEGLDGL